ncbi:MAG: hypothetical protein GY761_04560 [Hyphomicrobiales bacterium]|nr:hypothetical protein [Hyphomicrobiales bacterium]
MKIPSIALMMAALGFLSGLICTYAPEIVMEFTIYNTPVFQGIIFGAVIGFGQLRWGKGGLAGFVIILVFTTMAWIAAVNSFNAISDDAKTHLYPAAMIAGSIGASGTWVGAALANAIFRKMALLIPVIMVGALAGLLVILEVDSTSENFLVLFVVWQSAIAFCFGLALGGDPQQKVKS